MLRLRDCFKNQLATPLVLGGFALILLAIRLHAPAPLPPDKHPSPSGSPARSADGPALTELRQFRSGDQPVYSVCISPDGQTLASGGDDRLVRIWDIARGTILQTLSGHDSAVTGVAFSPDGSKLASAGGLSEHGLFLWNLKTGRPHPSLESYDGWISSAGFSSDSQKLYAVCEPSYDPVGYVMCWNSATGRMYRPNELDELAFRDSGGIGGIAISADGQYVAVANYTLRLWDLGSRREKRRFARSPNSTLLMRQVAFTGDGLSLLAGGLHGALALFDVATGDQIRDFPGHTDDICGLAISPDDARALSSGRDGTVRLWDLTTGRQLRCSSVQEGIVWAVAFAPDGKTAASAGEDGFVRIWSLP